jgi:tRNA1(Val) A37 N6-methylase TrmN6
MPFSMQACKQDVFDYLARSGLPRDAAVLDVGAGAGAYSDLLRGVYPNIDAVEAYAPYISRFNLESKYRVVFNADITRFDMSEYDLVIFGDVLEHLDVPAAQRVLAAACEHAREVLAVVPYLCVQDADGGVEYERHLQPDLTRGVFLARYPTMGLLCEHPAGTVTIAVFRKKAQDWL